jgi:phosphatidylglycerol:prolipoprotein diacylglycerol transferase
MFARTLSILRFPNINPVAFQIGPVAIRWYGIAYLLGFMLSYLILRRMSAKRSLGINRDALLDLMGWLVVGVVAGARLGWWIFYHRAEGVEPWYEPVAIWHGGMSFHGGLIGVAAALLVWCGLKGAEIWNIADALALVAPIGLCFGRIANFINAELVGRPTALAWGMVFPGDIVARHPSQLYEALLEGPVLLGAVWMARRRQGWQSSGAVAAVFVMLYGCFRFAVEFTREPDPQVGFIAFGWLTMGQLLSALLVVGGTLLWFLRREPSSLCRTN